MSKKPKIQSISLERPCFGLARQGVQLCETQGINLSWGDELSHSVTEPLAPGYLLHPSYSHNGCFSGLSLVSKGETLVLCCSFFLCRRLRHSSLSLLSRLNRCGIWKCYSSKVQPSGYFVKWRPLTDPKPKRSHYIKDRSKARCGGEGRLRSRIKTF